MAIIAIGTADSLTGTTATSDEYQIRRRGKDASFLHGYRVTLNSGTGNIAIEFAPDGTNYVGITDLTAITASKIGNINPVSDGNGKVRFQLTGGSSADFDVCVY